MSRRVALLCAVAVVAACAPQADPVVDNRPEEPTITINTAGAAAPTQPVVTVDTETFESQSVGELEERLNQLPQFDSSERIVVTGSRIVRGGFAGEETERYPNAEPNPLKVTMEEPISTFSVDVDTVSYAVVRRFLRGGELPPTDAVRVEELVNYFDYDYAPPTSADEPFALSATVAPSPWNPDTQILHIGIKGFDVAANGERPRANLTFLIDVSGSMQSEDKLPLVQRSLRLLIDELHDDDTVALVVYAGAAGAVLPPTPASERETILDAIDSLQAGGSTAGGEGLALAYSFAEASFDEEATNRIILATDGDFNVGVTDDEQLEDFVARKRETGIYLSVLGYGTGNYQDARMQAISQAGNGVAAYIDDVEEARKVLADEMASLFTPIADDVKIQVQFNPERVAEYRLIGYETRMLRREDFNNDEVDAGEVGAGHEVTAVYEITAPDSRARRVERTRYEAPLALTSDFGDEFGLLRVRYKRPGEDRSRLIERVVDEDDAVEDIMQAPAETRWVAAVAGYGQLLRMDPYMGGLSFESVSVLAESALGDDPNGRRGEFVTLARTAAALAQGRSAQVAGDLQ